MSRMCYLCERKASKIDGISLHKFPNNPIMRDKWIKACNLLNSDNLSYTYICSTHFFPSHVIKGNNMDGRTNLRTNAVPSIGLQNPVNSNNENINRFNTVVENMKVEEISITEDTFAETDKSLIEESNAQFMKQRRLSTDTDTIESNRIDDNIKKVQKMCDTTPKRNRRTFYPRYISEIETSDLGSPRKAKRILNFVREIDERKSKTIKTLEDKNRKLTKRISTLQQIVSHLKKKNRMSTEA